MEERRVCRSCQNPISETYFFCPYCGKKLKEPPLSTSIAKQIGIYLFAILCPPFGLIPGIKYLNQPDNRSKIIGLVTVLLTGFTLMMAIYYGLVMYQDFQNALSSQGLDVGLGINGL